MSSLLRPQIFSSARDLPPEWDVLALAQSNTMSRAFWQVVEEGELGNFACRYALFYDAAGKEAAVAGFYEVTTDIAIFAPPFLRKFLQKIRKVFPNFLKLRMLECGTPVTLNSPPFAARPDIDPTAVVAALHQLLQSIARQEGHLLIVVRDFEPEAFALKPLFTARGYHWVQSLPNTYLTIHWDSPDAYLAAMKSYFRSKTLKHLKRNPGVRHQLVEGFQDLAETLWRQWMIVHTQADEFQREILSPAFYRSFATHMGAEAKALLFYREEKLVGHVLLLKDGPTLRWLYFGREEAVNDSLYLYAAHKAVETAILLGAKKVEMGLTTYPIKLDLGAEPAPIRLAIKATTNWLNPLVGFFYPLMNHLPEVQGRDVFKKKAF